jgi:hypothetical protein
MIAPAGTNVYSLLAPLDSQHREKNDKKNCYSPPCCFGLSTLISADTLERDHTQRQGKTETETSSLRLADPAVSRTPAGRGCSQSRPAAPHDSAGEAINGVQPAVHSAEPGGQIPDYDFLRPAGRVRAQRCHPDALGSVQNAVLTSMIVPITTG